MKEEQKLKISKIKFDYRNLDDWKGHASFEKKSCNNEKELLIYLSEEKKSTMVWIPWEVAEALAEWIQTGAHLDTRKNPVFDDDTLRRQMRQFLTSLSQVKTAVTKLNEIADEHREEKKILRTNKLPNSRSQRFDF